MKLSARLSVLFSTYLLTLSLAWADVPFLPNQGIAGSWYNPDTAGQGFLIDQLPTASNTMVAYWFTYDPENPGDQLWLTGTGKLVGTSAEISFIRVTAGVFNDPAAVSVDENWATVIFTFTDCNNAMVDFSIPSLTLAGQHNILRITPDFSCASGGVSPPPDHFDGTFLGEWHNTTFDSRGDATAIISYDADNENFDLTLDMDGSVFGQGDPDPIIFNDLNFNGQTELEFNDPTFGSCTFIFEPSGMFSGTCAPPAFTRVDFDGSLSPAHFAMSYEIFAGESLFAEGLVTMSRSE